MRDYKRHIKTVILIFLIVLNFVLVIRLWSAANYFGTGFKDVINEFKDSIKYPVIKIFNELGNKNADEKLDYILRPKRIVVNTTGKRSILNDNHKDFENFNKLCSEVINKVAVGEVKIVSHETVSEGEYLLSLKSKSVLVDYDNKYQRAVFSQIAGGEGMLSEDKDFVVREFVLNFSDSLLNKTYLFIKDYKTNNVYKCNLEMKQTDFNKLIDEHFAQNESSDMPFYSFEMNFHEGGNSEGHQSNVIFDPLITVGLVPNEYNLLSSANLEVDENKLMEIFGINIISAGKYKDIDGSRNFVANNADLKISSEGFIEYSASDEGIKIADLAKKEEFDVCRALSSVSEFFKEISKTLGYDNNLSLRVSEDLDGTTNSDVYKICFDYHMNGVPILQESKTTKELNHSVIAEVKNGYLTYYKQYVKQYKNEKDVVLGSAMITAADEFMSNLTEGTKQLKIEKAYEGYIDSGNEFCGVDWVIKAEGNSKLYR